MAFRISLSFLVLVFLSACAQVGQISGGEKDTVAPQVIASKTTPPSNSTQFNGNSISMTFDEFIQVNNPQQTLVMIPKHARPTISVNKKTATIEWKEDLQANTTYVLYLNGTIEDVAEGNDSLMAYAFSTGDFVDSLRYSVKVEDAFTNIPLQDVTVGLFTDKDSTKPYYFAKTTQNGTATFNYLKAGNYFVKAFLDENKDLEIQSNEKVGFRSEQLSLEKTLTDTNSLRVFTEKGADVLKSLRFYPPNSFVLQSNYSLENAELFCNKIQLKKEQIKRLKTDSVQFFLPVKDLSELEVVVQRGNQLNDTISLKIAQKEKSEKLTFIPAFKELKVKPIEPITFHVNDLITRVFPEKIKLINKEDSTEIKCKVLFSSNELTLDLDRKSIQNIQFIAQKGAVLSQNGLMSDSINTSFILRQEKEFGVIQLNLSAFKSPVIVEVILQSKTVDRIPFQPAKTCTLSYLEAGEYQFRVILDENNNGKWDTGSIKEWRQAEKCMVFTNPIKVRSNWEIEAELIPN